MRYAGLPAHRNISIHAPAWGATFSSGFVSLLVIRFQSTPPHGERLILRISLNASFTFQSTPPHGERPAVVCDISAVQCISIHAPAWGATGAVGGFLANRQHFNPRPRMGSDKRGLPKCFLLLQFQSTPPHGERQVPPGPVEGSGEISIHAPAWGATANRLYHSHYNQNFNPRPRMGSDRQWSATYQQSNSFQSTPPHGERPSAGGLVVSLDVFQSTPPHGERLFKGHNTTIRSNISIHAPAWGATLSAKDLRYKYHHFNPRPRMGSDNTSSSLSLPCAYFNPRPRMGSDPTIYRMIARHNYFNPRPRMGSDSKNMRFLLCFCNFH